MDFIKSIEPLLQIKEWIIHVRCQKHLVLPLFRLPFAGLVSWTERSNYTASNLRKWLRTLVNTAFDFENLIEVCHSFEFVKRAGSHISSGESHCIYASRIFFCFSGFSLVLPCWFGVRRAKKSKVEMSDPEVEATDKWLFSRWPANYQQLPIGGFRHACYGSFQNPSH